jgi:MFS family permease
VFYLTLFYTRGELGFRIALFFGSALLGSAFSGLISFGVFQIKNTSLHGWQWLFIIEGTTLHHQLPIIASLNSELLLTK